MSKILVVAPHPDDEVLGCGGTIARHVANGDEVHIAVVTRGAADLYSADLIELGRDELREAHRVLGVAGVTFLDYPAPRLDSIAQHLVADGIRRVVEEVCPHTVYLPHAGDVHIDHKITYWATLVACRPNHADAPRQMLSYETLSETEWGSPQGADAFVPTVFHDITEFLAKKIEAMECYRTQLKAAPHSRSVRAIEALAGFRGATVNLLAAEGFMLLRSVS